MQWGLGVCGLASRGEMDGHLTAAIPACRWLGTRDRLTWAAAAGRW